VILYSVSKTLADIIRKIEIKPDVETERKEKEKPDKCRLIWYMYKISRDKCEKMPEVYRKYLIATEVVEK